MLPPVPPQTARPRGEGEQQGNGRTDSRASQQHANDTIVVAKTNTKTQKNRATDVQIDLRVTEDTTSTYTQEDNRPIDGRG